MLNFEFQNPTKIIFGKGEIAKLPSLLSKDKKILIAYGGGSIKQNGVYDQVTTALRGYTTFEFGGIEPNPEYSTLMKAVELIRKEDIDYILAVGGGSVIDGIKFVSAAVYHEGDAWEITEKGMGKKIDRYVPFGSVLTLPATGSEMNSGAVINRSELKLKLVFGGPNFFPQFSILDPTVVRSLPTRQIANGIVDAFTHTMEQYLTYPHSAHLQDRIAEGILHTLIEIAPKVMADPSDYESAANFMWSATMALNGLLRCGVPTDWATHMIGHELTALHGIDHARTLAIIGPNLYRKLLDAKKEKLAQYGARIWGLKGDNQEEIALQAIDKTVAFFHSLGIETKLSDYTDAYSDTSRIVYERFEERGWKMLGERKNIGPQLAKEIVEMSI
jgi:NADP-dependent alcohol dehydrogenase